MSEIRVFQNILPESVQTPEAPEDGILRIRKMDHGVEINGQHFKKLVVHVADATLLASLRSLQEEDTAVIVIDPLAYVGTQILDGVKTGKDDIFGFLTGDDVLFAKFIHITEASQEQKVIRRIRDLYREEEQKAKKGLEEGRLFLLQQKIEDVELPEGSVDEITYYYPYMLNPALNVFDFAMQTLHEGGKFHLVTENETTGKIIYDATKRSLHTLHYTQLPVGEECVALYGLVLRELHPEWPQMISITFIKGEKAVEKMHWWQRFRKRR